MSVLCRNPDAGLVVTQLFASRNPKRWPGVQGSLGLPGHASDGPPVPPARGVALPSPGIGDTGLTGGHSSPGYDTCLKY